MAVLKALDFRSLANQPLRVLVIEERLSPRKQLVQWLQRRKAVATVDGLSPVALWLR